jgi:hypothetical protein
LAIETTIDAVEKQEGYITILDELYHLFGLKKGDYILRVAWIPPMLEGAFNDYGKIRIEIIFKNNKGEYERIWFDLEMEKASILNRQLDRAIQNSIDTIDSIYRGFIKKSKEVRVENQVEEKKVRDSGIYV